jgi:hypothetical protein
VALDSSPNNGGAAGGGTFEIQLPLEAPKVILDDFASAVTLCLHVEGRRLESCAEVAVASAMTALFPTLAANNKEADEQQQPPAAATTTASSAEGGVRLGAVPVAGFIEKLVELVGSERAERTTRETLLSNIAELSAFENGGEECLSCSVTAVANKAHHHHHHSSSSGNNNNNNNDDDEDEDEDTQNNNNNNNNRRFWRCFDPAQRLGIEALCELSSSDSFCWRSLAASFSTMMRYFQKAKSDFSWGTSAAGKTVIRLAAAASATTTTTSKQTLPPASCNDGLEEAAVEVVEKQQHATEEGTAAAGAPAAVAGNKHQQPASRKYLAAAAVATGGLLLDDAAVTTLPAFRIQQRC